MQNQDVCGTGVNINKKTYFYFYFLQIFKLFS